MEEEERGAQTKMPQKPLTGFPSGLIKPIKSVESMGMRAVPERGSIMIHVLRPERPVPFVHAARRTAGH